MGDCDMFDLIMLAVFEIKYEYESDLKLLSYGSKSVGQSF